MKLRNKKTGEIVETSDCDLGIMPFNSEIRLHGYNYNSLAELCEEWEDYKGPKELYFVDARQVDYIGILNTKETPKWCASLIELGLGFETAEETEKAVEKLKAWKRLEDKGFEFRGYGIQDDYLVIKTNFHRPLIGEELDLTLNAADSPNADLDLLFSQEDE